MGRIIGDGQIYFYIQDVIVKPKYQGIGYGKRLMDELMEWWENNHDRRGFMMLMAAEGKAAFYEQYGGVRI